MDVIVRSNNYPVNDMTAPVSWLINDLDMAIKTKSSVLANTNRKNVTQFLASNFGVVDKRKS